ncbi:hypothetical protein COCSUDRAFT_67424 [Coccomyxa subellipsoidea C-169]|uniref:Uncharacterized protein n=1 Tax=Coccomyxa subellipsoidea (strain C-169) TaxID=574566 RepID=I0YQ95_COCSC|nr:hypothetical protein COCSUDRAFT_67424 [Coccomyxa subellipsoidea C-169]EIE20564.1 hypothetical protein COCSUDRAFT_67424 [Coccomyxa subellipsoidea C-169]|eukprot:XP_005645108.1 hypothetical protein COCSUDRAFT_67424 [Coccomyxa subellipsoidea C-169]
MRRTIVSAAFLLIGCLIASAYDTSDLEVYPGRSLLHDDKKTDYGCQCKNANWYCHGYCNIGTTSGDVQGCMRDCLICCGWGGAPPAAPKTQETPAPTPEATPAPQAEQPAAAAEPTPAPKTPAAPAGLTKSATPSPQVRVVNTQGRRLHQKSSSPPSSPSGNWGGDGKKGDGGDWKGNGKKDEGKKDDGKKDPNQCWNSFWSKYPWKN